MKKIYLVAAGSFLVLLIIITILLSLGKKSTTNTQKNSLFPTGIPPQGSTNQQTNLQNNQPSPSESEGSLNTVSQTANGGSINIATIPPVETSDFKLQYSPELNKIVVEKKTPQAEQKFTEWANQNNYSQLISNPDLVFIINKGQGPSDFNPLIEFLNIFMNFGQGVGSSTQNSSPTISPPISTTPSTTPSSTSNPPSSSFTYFSQCGDLGSLPLPDGCTLCNAGCGPTTVSMIASSYLGQGYDPKTIVDTYKSKGYSLGCGGSYVSNAYELLKNLGLKTTNYFIFNAEKADTVVPQLRKYLNDGWTFFTLPRFCDDPEKGY
ncbi:MAG TPA: hypothetical protein VF385_02905, partial [Patescibacteria group bacterium]